jgi:hypothetical protein
MEDVLNKYVLSPSQRRAMNKGYKEKSTKDYIKSRCYTHQLTDKQIKKYLSYAPRFGFRCRFAVVDSAFVSVNCVYQKIDGKFVNVHNLQLINYSSDDASDWYIEDGKHKIIDYLKDFTPTGIRKTIMSIDNDYFEINNSIEYGLDDSIEKVIEIEYDIFTTYNILRSLGICGGGNQTHDMFASSIIKERLLESVNYGNFQAGYRLQEEEIEPYYKMNCLVLGLATDNKYYGYKESIDYFSEDAFKNINKIEVYAEGEMKNNLLMWIKNLTSD